MVWVYEASARFEFAPCSMMYKLRHVGTERVPQGVLFVGYYASRVPVLVMDVDVD